MALNVGELEAVLRMRDELSRTADQAQAALKRFAAAGDSVRVSHADANKILGQSDQKYGALGGTLTQLGGIIAGVFAAHKIIQFGQASIESYSKQEAALTKLAAALKAQGTYTPALVRQYEELASQFQQTTIYADDLTADMMALLAQVGNVMPGQMSAALTAATNLASGLGIDLRTATMLVGKAFAGETGTLARYGIVLDETAASSRDATQVLDAINQKFGGQAQAQMQTYAGQIAMVSNAWDDFREAVGKILVDVIQPMLPAVRDLITMLQGVGGVVQGARGAFDSLLASGLSTLKWMTDARTTFLEWTNVAGMHNDTLALLRQQSDYYGGAIQGLTTQQQKHSEAVDSGTAQLSAHRQEIGQTTEAAARYKTAVDEWTAGILAHLNAHAEKLKAVQREVDAVERSATAGRLEALASWSEYGARVQAHYAGIEQAAVNATAQAQQAERDLAQALYDEAMAADQAAVAQGRLNEAKQAAIPPANQYTEVLSRMTQVMIAFGAGAYSFENVLSSLFQYYANAGRGLQSYLQGSIPPGGRLPGMAAGGPVSAGRPVVVGERGPELFVPRSGGAIVPNGVGAVNVTVNVTQPLGTPAQIARAVNDALSQTLKAQGLRMPLPSNS